MDIVNHFKIKTPLFFSRHWVQKMDNFKEIKDTITFVDKEISNPKGHGQYSIDEGKRRIGGRFSVVERELRQAFLDLIHKTRRRHLSRGKIDAPKLYKAGADIDLKVFFEPASVIRISSAFSLLIDLSGSMSGSKLDIAGDLSYLFGTILSRLNIPFEVAGFTTGGTQTPRGYSSSTSDKKIYRDRRFDCVHYTVYKDFKNRWNNRFPYLETLSAGGYTPTHDALAIACSRILDRHEHKKVVLVITDGQPCIGNMSRYKLRRELRIVIARARKQGIRVIGIGPEDADIHNNFSDFVAVHDESDLTKAVFDKLKELLLSEAMKSKLGIRF